MPGKDSAYPPANIFARASKSVNSQQVENRNWVIFTSGKSQPISKIKHIHDGLVFFNQMLPSPLHHF